MAETARTRSRSTCTTCEASSRTGTRRTCRHRRRASWLEGLQEAEDWLYTEEGEDATKSAYVQKLDALKVIGDAIVHRHKEAEERPKAASQLREVLNLYLSQAQSGDEQYSHIDEAEKTKVVSTGQSNHRVLVDARTD